MAFAVVDRENLAEALRGDNRFVESAHLTQAAIPRLREGQVAVLWSARDTQPKAIFVREAERDEIFSWLVTFHRELTPLTSWCHVFDVNDLTTRSFGEPLYPDLFGLEAAWAGAMLAEAMNLSGRSYDALSLNALLATEVFAIARAAGLYGRKTASGAAMERLERLRRIFRPGSHGRPRSSDFVVEVLLSLMPGAGPSGSPIVRILGDLCEKLLDDESIDQVRYLERAELSRLTSEFPSLAHLADIPKMSAEERVSFLRHLRVDMPAVNSVNWPLFAFGAGYTISRIGSAERDLRLADDFGDGKYSILSWAAVAGSLGARTFWTDAFDGLGRYAARELVRPLHHLDPPTADVSFEELRSFENGGRPLRLRGANKSAVAVSLFPGVSIQFGLSEINASSRQPVQSKDPALSPELPPFRPDQLQTLADWLLPYLKPQLQSSRKNPERSPRKATPRLFKE